MNGKAEPRKRTITMTDRAPVRIIEDDWPVVAIGTYDDHDGQVRCQANRTWKCAIRVRRHEDGRAIVYGFYNYDTNFQNEDGILTRAGELLDLHGVGIVADEDIVASIRAVGATIRENLESAGFSFDDHVLRCAQECIADLPPEEI